MLDLKSKYAQAAGGNMARLDELYVQLQNALGEERVRRDEPMAAHTSFRAGGPADLFLTPSDETQAARAVRICREAGEEPFILGNGSNLLVSDTGYRGVVLDMSGVNGILQVLDSEGCSNVQRALRQVRVEAGAGAKLSAVARFALERGASGVECLAGVPGAGAKLSQVARFALERGAAGMECLAGIPGTVGGAAVMNAGAYGGEMKDVLRSVTVLTREGKLETVFASELDLGYRHSLIPEKGYIVLSAEFVLQKGDPEAIRAKMDDLAAQRRAKQPLEFPSAGSTFKRPEGHYAGAMIQEAGLKGRTVGGAQVSEKHAGFIINIGGATCGDVMNLVKLVQDAVQSQTGYYLEREIIRTGR